MQKNHYARDSQFYSPVTSLATSIFDYAHQKIFDQLLIFVNLYQHAKNQFIPSVHSSDTVNFKVPSHDWPHSFLTMPTPKTFKSIFMKFTSMQKIS